MNTKNKMQKVVLLGLAVVSVVILAFAIDTPKPVKADSRIPCVGYICIDDLDDPHVVSCMMTGSGFAWSCTNYCYRGGVGFCQGVAQCVAWCGK